mmetsp:Transcript_5206/g.8050  ORF Transcript_5206/g.8050 Transcript_5206/m.8050 type:complete len:105 (+) Transcript_5206:361-675(+)
MRQFSEEQMNTFGHHLDFSAHVPKSKNVSGALKPKEDEWCVSEEISAVEDDFLYVNLNDNKESFTAYNGTQIWNALYEDNCMLDKIDKFGLNPTETCQGETLLY